jgi:hypothetical protein
MALGLPWKNEDGAPATEAEITDEWNMVKSGFPTYQSVNSKNIPGLHHLYLDNDAISQLVISKMHQNEGTLRQHYPNYDDWPADAQMGLHSMAWAMGPAFNFPSFKAATDKLDFDTAAAQGQMRPSPGIAPRNAANKALFQNAAIVQKSGGDPEVLWYPSVAKPGSNWKPYVVGGILLIAAAGGTYYMLRGKAS